jgi:transketolase
LESFYVNGGKLAGHSTRGAPGIEVSTGSLGHGLPIACGMALAAKRDAKDYRIFCILSDGECDEGSNWEAALFAGHHRLDNLTVIIDYNKIQSLGHVRDILNLEPFADKWTAFRWETREIDGHDIGMIDDALEHLPFAAGKPSCLIAHTVKGKGVSFMEDQLLWHYRTPQGEEYESAVKELRGPA